MISKYTTPDLDDKVIDDILDYGQYGKYVYQPNLDWDNNSKRQDIILYNDNTHSAKMSQDLLFNDSVDVATRTPIKAIITKYWDCFVKEGAKRTILGYEFGINTGGSKPVAVGNRPMDRMNLR